jgi:DNA recombination protein RmuC
MIVRLPNGRQVVVDAKVPLKAYLEALEASGEAERTAKLKEHAAQLRAHLDRLAAKAYWNQFEPAPEFVVAFVPGEAFFSAALQQDPELIDYGAGRRVLLATPTTLIALLLSVAYGWREERLARNADEVRNLGRTLYERLRTFSEHLLRLGRNLEQAVAAFNDAAASLETRVLVSARRFRELGAATGEIPAVEPLNSQPRLPES